jgi:hypothetical protein
MDRCNWKLASVSWKGGFYQHLPPLPKYVIW